ncbi:hypothetical protein LCGC14_1898250 [marine sediment metagenome]|uniref:Uncharacterized protein n=1 Tax=marine sediment metagenome TaxID=412755 RepID=A0A0F9GKR5_9ZZZZ
MPKRKKEYGLIKKQISKNDFEIELLKKFGNKLGKKVVTSYYVNNKHIASWSKGKGWIKSDK